MNYQNQSNLPLKRPAITQRRLLGEARRETAEAAHIAASKRRRRLSGPSGEDKEEDDDDGDNDGPYNYSGSQPHKPVSSGALGDDDVAVFGDAVYDKDDQDADKVYEAVEKRMQSRRQKHRELKLQQQLKEYRDANPTIRQQFAHLKSNLQHVSQDEWAGIPDIGDYSIRKEQVKKYTPIPDSLLEKARQDNSNGMITQVIDEDGNGNINGNTDLAAIGAGRSSVLGHNLDSIRSRNSSIATTTTTTNTTSTINSNVLSTHMNSMNTSSIITDGLLAAPDFDMTGAIGDVKKMRTLLKSITVTNPSHAPGWIAAARLEQRTGKALEARRLILHGCRACPRDEDVWVEAARLHPVDAARRLLAQAVRHLPKSELIWTRAADLENEDEDKRRILRKALEILPGRVKLWMYAVQLEQPQVAKILLRKAVTCVEKSKQLWLALSRLEKYEEAIQVLEKARTVVDENDVIDIWTARTQLEETQHGKEHKNVLIVMKEAVKDTCDFDNVHNNNDDDKKKEEKMEKKEKEKEKGQMVDKKITAEKEKKRIATKREQWLQTAEVMEKAGYIGTVRAIVVATAPLISLPSPTSSASTTSTTTNLLDIWKSDAKRYEDKGNIEMARAFWSYMCETYPTRISLWRLSAEFEQRQRHDVSQIEQVLKRGVTLCPQAEILWLMFAKHVWKHEDDDVKAREILNRAFKIHPQSQAVWLAAAKLETETKRYEKAREILTRARQILSVVDKRRKAEEEDCWKVYMKSALLERMLRNHVEEKRLLIQGLGLYEKAEKLWLMLAQWFERKERHEFDVDLTGEEEEEEDVKDGHEGLTRLWSARGVYNKAVTKCPKSIALWLGYCRLEQEQQEDVNASKARARAILERGRHACTSVGRGGNTKDKDVDQLWRENVFIEMRNDRRSLSNTLSAKHVLDRGLQQCGQSGILWAVAIGLEEKRGQKLKSVEAVKQCGNDVDVMRAVAQFLWRTGKIEKAREWFRRAVETNRTHGDAWATWIAFEREQGQGGDEVMRMALENELVRGDWWIACRKKVGHELKSKAEILEMVIQKVGKEADVTGAFTKP